jgi:hypothetical protein
MKDLTVYVTTTRTGKVTVRTRAFDAATLEREGMTQTPAAMNWKAARAISASYEAQTGSEGR